VPPPQQPRGGQGQNSQEHERFHSNHPCRYMPCPSRPYRR
jgi:hypothetical protein